MSGVVEKRAFDRRLQTPFPASMLLSRYREHSPDVDSVLATLRFVSIDVSNECARADVIVCPIDSLALCLGFITGTGGLPRRLGFSCMCAARVPVAPAVGAMPLCLRLVPRWHRVRCDVGVVYWLDACTAAWLGDCRLWLV